MSLTLAHCTPSDVPSIVNLSAAAFSVPSPSNIFPDTSSFNDFRTKRFQHTFAHDPFTLFTKIVDSSLPPSSQLIAFAKWMVPCTKEEKEKSGFVDLLLSDEAPRDEIDMDLIREMEQLKEKHFDEIMGDKKCYYLNVLATHPLHSGRGCASQLVKWGMQRADEEGIECYVEAQDSSKPIFLRYGWKEVRELLVRGQKWGTVLVYTPGKGSPS